jgi:hypothetical protein
MFHSSPVAWAECVRLDEPTYAVEKPDARWKSQALAWSRVVLRSYEMRTDAPRSTRASRAARSVEPV